MNLEYNDSSQNFDEFSEAKKQFMFLTNGIRDKVKSMEHGDLEAFLDKEGKELIRCVLQGHLDRLALEEPMHEAVAGSDGIERRQRRENTERELMTLFGEVTVSRIRYGHPGEASLHPLDARLNLPADKYSHNLRKRVAEEAAKVSFDETVKSIKRTTGSKVGKLQAEQLVARASQDFEDFYSARKVTKTTGEKDFLVISLDGKGIVMKREGLRESTRKAAARETHKLRTRLSRGEKSNRKRMATVATVYAVEEHHRTPEQIMNLENGPAEARPKPVTKRVWASVEREPEAIAKEVFDEAESRDPQRQRNWALLVDGHVHQLKNVWAQIIERGLEGVVTPILDFIHVLEYLWKAAYCFYEEGSEEAEAWVQKRAFLILQGKSSSVAGGIRSSASKLNLPEQAREPADKCADYLLKYRSMLRYDKYLKLVMPIATGVIEGACRHLIKDRLDITGARWSLAGAEAVLKLRSLRSSGDFDEYWEFHRKQEQKRCHLSHYKQPKLVLAA
ncbi:MAG: ISKra4 family transposase [Candidatus Obscuribacterales bacterium]|nr:ISKra4 family transposase [Candidatus Obscuribacterales bacterium]